MANRYHRIDNPDGAIPLNIAENHLCWAELSARISRVTADKAIPSWVPGYANHRGALPFRAAAASFLSEHLTGTPVSPHHLAISAGATSVVEMTAIILADAGDVAVIPAPAYPVYSKDLGNVAGVRRYDLVTHHELDEVAKGPILAVHHLERALEELEAEGRRFRMLVLTTPDNPTGAIYPPELMSEIAAWCEERRIHMVVNELYGLSLIDTSHPSIATDYVDPPPFVSFGRLMDERRSDYLHLWYALSKDLGISGFRVGMLYSHNEALITAYENLNLTHSVSNHTQWIMREVISDTPFMTKHIDLSRTRLTSSYAIVVEALRRASSPVRAEPREPLLLARPLGVPAGKLAGGRPRALEAVVRRDRRAADTRSRLRTFESVVCSASCTPASRRRRSGSPWRDSSAGSPLSGRDVRPRVAYSPAPPRYFEQLPRGGNGTRCSLPSWSESRLKGEKEQGLQGGLRTLPPHTNAVAPRRDGTASPRGTQASEKLPAQTEGPPAQLPGGEAAPRERCARPRRPARRRIFSPSS